MRAPSSRRADPLHERAREVLGYFLRNPGAADDLEGIARWRIEQEAVRRIVAEVDEAVVWLLQQGYLTVASTPGSGPIFRLNTRRLREARRFAQR